MADKWKKLLETAEGEVTRVLCKLPEPLRDKASVIPVVFQVRPKPEEQDENFDTDLLGMFVGYNFADAGSDSEPEPARIILYPENIWDYAEGKQKAYRREVRRTYLHELGHYIGFEEDDLLLRGLD